MAKAKRSASLAQGPQACLLALRSLASLGSAGGDAYNVLHSQSQWPSATKTDINNAFTVLSNGKHEVPAHVIGAALQALKGLSLVPGFKVRMPAHGSDTANPAFVKGTGRSPAHLRLRDFVDSLVLTTEATLARNATDGALSKLKTRLPEQRALRQHLGLPKAATAAEKEVHFCRRVSCFDLFSFQF